METMSPVGYRFALLKHSRRECQRVKWCEVGINNSQAHELSGVIGVTGMEQEAMAESILLV